MTLRAALIDIDGTVVRGDTLLPGAVDGVTILRKAGFDLLFLSNNPTKTSAGYAAHLRKLGLDVTDDEVLTSADATADHLARERPDERLFVIGSDPLLGLFEERDLTVVDDPDEADAVVASFDSGFDYADLTAALWAIDGGADLLGTDPDRSVPAAGGRLVPGSGAILRAVAAAAEREPDRVLGKPSQATVDLALSRLGVDATECLMIGDRLTTDIRMGERAGMVTVLVLTGVTDRADLDDAAVTPDHVLASLGKIDQVLSGRQTKTVADEGEPNR